MSFTNEKGQEDDKLRENIVRVNADHENRKVLVYDHNKDDIIGFNKFYLLPNYTDIPLKLGLSIGGRKVKSRKAVRPTVIFGDIGTGEATIKEGKPKECKVPVKAHGNKQFNKELSEYLGMPPKTWMKVFNANMFSVFIEPVNWYVNQFARRHWDRKILNGSLTRVWELKPLLDEVYNDGLYHLLPLVYKFELPPKEIKKEVGSKTWKRLARNTFTRNKLLAYASNGNTRELRDSVDIRSTILREYGGLWSDVMGWVQDNRNCPMNHKQRMDQLVHLYRDTKEMCFQLGQDFNPKWSLRRMQEEHERMSKLKNEQKYGTEPFEYPFNDFVIEEGKWSAEVLTNPTEVAAEGQAMHHCVSMMVRWCQDLRYFVVSIKYNGMRSSTLGIEYYPPKGKREGEYGDQVWFESSSESIRIQQHFGLQNRRITDPDEKQIAQKAKKVLEQRLEEGGWIKPSHLHTIDT